MTTGRCPHCKRRVAIERAVPCPVCRIEIRPEDLQRSIAVPGQRYPTRGA